MEGGASDERKYPSNREVACAVCSTDRAVYTMWGKTKCPSSTSNTLYEGFAASSYYTHNGGGGNYLCMHQSPQYPKGYSTGNQQGNLLYGVEYQNQANQNRDAACAVCQHKTLTNVYVQWGRTSCSNGQVSEYSGMVMSTHYTQKKSSNICVDLAREGHMASSNSDQNGGMLYKTEMESGAADETLYKTNREVACV